MSPLTGSGVLADSGLPSLFGRVSSHRTRAAIDIGALPHDLAYFLVKPFNLQIFKVLNYREGFHLILSGSS